MLFFGSMKLCGHLLASSLLSHFYFWLASSLLGGGVKSLSSYVSFTLLIDYSGNKWMLNIPSGKCFTCVPHQK